MDYGMPGGGGLGNAKGRDPKKVENDLLNGLISESKAKEDYGYSS